MELTYGPLPNATVRAMLEMGVHNWHSNRKCEARACPSTSEEALWLNAPSGRKYLNPHGTCHPRLARAAEETLSSPQPYQRRLFQVTGAVMAKCARATDPWASRLQENLAALPSPHYSTYALQHRYTLQKPMNAALHTGHSFVLASRISAHARHMHWCPHGYRSCVMSASMHTAHSRTSIVVVFLAACVSTRSCCSRSCPTKISSSSAGTRPAHFWASASTVSSVITSDASWMTAIRSAAAAPACCSCCCCFWAFFALFLSLLRAARASARGPSLACSQFSLRALTCKGWMSLSLAGSQNDTCSSISGVLTMLSRSSDVVAACSAASASSVLTTSNVA